MACFPSFEKQRELLRSLGAGWGEPVGTENLALLLQGWDWESVNRPPGAGPGARVYLGHFLALAARLDRATGKPPSSVWGGVDLKFVFWSHIIRSSNCCSVTSEPRCPNL